MQPLTEAIRQLLADHGITAVIGELIAAVNAGPITSAAVDDWTAALNRVLSEAESVAQSLDAERAEANRD